VLGTREPDAFGTELHRHLRVVGGVGVGAHTESSIPVGEFHDGPERSGELRVDGGDASGVQCTRRAVQRNPVAFGQLPCPDAHAARGVVDDDLPGAGNAALAHPARDHRRVTGHAPTCGENPLRRVHPADVLRTGLDAGQDDTSAHFRPPFGFFGVEDNLTGGRTRRGGQPLGQHVGLLLGNLVEDGVKELVECRGGHAQDGRLLVDESLFGHVHGDPDVSGGGAFAGAGLKHEESPALDGELDVLHVAVVLLEFHADAVELSEHPGHGFLERRVEGLAGSLVDALVSGPVA